VLEIGPQARLVWTTNFGSETHAYDTSQETVESGGPGRVFTAGEGDLAIRITVRQERCIDDGEVEFDHSAMVEFGGRTLRGCGTRLNGG
jgi:uncharacterized membrane protein